MRVDETGTPSLYNIFDFVLATVYCSIPVMHKYKVMHFDDEIMWCNVHE